MSFTLQDKVLLDRAARLIKEEADVLMRSECPPAGWGATDASKKAKLVFDRLKRDERDLRALGKRLCAHFGVAPAPRAPKEEPAPPAAGGSGESLEPGSAVVEVPALTATEVLARQSPAEFMAQFPPVKGNIDPGTGGLVLEGGAA